jgi:PAS domain S-box-containing protein
VATNSNSSIEERLAELEAENARLRDALARSSPAQRQRRSDAADLTFHAIADSIDQLIWTTLPDGYHDYFNRRWYEYTGMSEGSTDGEEWNGMFHPDDQERAWAVWRRCLDTGERYHIEYRLRHRSGEYRWVLGRAQPVRDESGAIIRWYGTCTDIHDLKLAEERLRESEARHARAIEAGQIGDYAWDLTTGEIRWSHNLMRIVGLSPDTEVTGEKVFELIHPDDRERVQSVVSRAIESGEQLEADYRVVATTA